MGNIKAQAANTCRALAACAAAAFLSAAGSATASASVIIDLVNNNTGTSNGAIYDFAPNGSTGTGVIQSFLRIQKAGQGGVEQGYNNDVGTPWDTKGGLFTRDITLGDLVAKVIGGVGYYEFLLDINQDQNDPLLSLNMIQIFTRPTPIAAAPESLAGLGTLRFDMDVGGNGDTTVLLDSGRNSGSGYGDMFLYVPTSLFAGVAATENLYFYSLFGATSGHLANDGFEEWATVKQAPIPAPEPSSLVVLLVGLLGLLSFGYVRTRRTGA